MWIFTLILLSKFKKYIIEQNILIIGRGTDERFISQNYGVFAKAEI